MKTTAEIVIAGAGMAGVSAAHQLAVREGAARVVLVDPREPLSLTSSKGTEAYRNYWPGPDDTMVRFMDRSVDLLDALDPGERTRFRVESQGLCVPHRRSRPKPSGLRRHEGPTTEYHRSGERFAQRYPFVTDRVLAMLHVRRAGYMNAVKLGRPVARTRARAHGVDLICDEVTEARGRTNQRFPASARVRRPHQRARVRAGCGSAALRRGPIVSAGRADGERAARQDLVR